MKPPGQLERSNARLRRETPLERSRLKPVSDERRAENRVRRRNLHEAYGDRPTCHMGPVLATVRRVVGQQGPPRCKGLADDGHEVFTAGRGGLRTDPANVMPACRACHDYATTHPLVAAFLGLVTGGPS